MPACTNCDQENPESARFCFNCGTEFPHAEPLRLEERKVVTVLFCDLVGFTARSDRADPEDVRATLRPYHAMVRQLIRRFQGTLEKFAGDAAMAVFGAPLAHEDDAERAVEGALRILVAIRELNEENPDLNLAVRIGIDTGEAVVNLAADAVGSESQLAGDVVNTASRIETAAPVGTVVVGEATYRATRDVFEYEELEPARVKGKAQPVPIWRVKARRSRYGSDVDTRPATPFFDREDEMEVLKRTFGRALRERTVQMVTLMGEPGIGKSRLIREFFTFIDAHQELVFWRHGRCLSYGEGITFWPLREIVKAQAGILESDDPVEVAAKLDAAVTALVESGSEREWLRARLTPLVGLTGVETGSSERTETFAAWRRFFEAMTSVYPLVLVFEDLHWADDAMLEFIDYLADWSTDVPLLILASSRPELYERRPEWGGGKRNSTTISLAPLPDEQIWQLVSALLSESADHSQVPGLIRQQAGGNPLYAEEFARMLSDRRVVDGSFRPGSADALFPQSIQAIIAARIDSLSSDRKALLQAASVVGKVFWSGALASMTGLDEGTVKSGLHELARKELVRPARKSTIEDQAEYSFWHSLIGDVAYAQVPRSTRARKHRQAAEWMQSLAGDRVTDHAELLAYHYGQALDLARAAGDVTLAADLEAPTRNFLVMAGDRALGLDANRAADHYGRGLGLLPSDSDERGPLLVRAAEAEAGAGRFAEAEQTYLEAIGELRARGDLRGAGGAMVKLSILLWHRGETARCREVLGQAVTLLEREPPSPELAHAYAAQAEDKIVLGVYEEALQWSKRALALMDVLGVREHAPGALLAQGMARWYLGDETGVEDLQQALEMAITLGLGRDAARIQAALGELLWVTEGPRRGLTASQEAVDLAERRGNAEMAMALRSEMLGPMADMGQWDDVLGVADLLTKWSSATGEGYFTIVAAVYRANVLLCRGEVAQALALAERFMPAARGIADPQVVVEALAVAAFIERERGELMTAIQLIEELEGLTQARPTWFRAKELPELIRTCVAGDALTLAARLLQGLPVQATRHKLSFSTAEAVMREARGDHEGALDAYERSADGWGSFGHVLEQGRTLLGAGRCLARLGNAQAADRFREARSIFASLGATPLVGDAESWLGRAAVQIP